MASDEYGRTGALDIVAPVTSGTDEGDGHDPSVPSAAYERMRPRWEKCRAVALGTEAIRDGGTDYVPQFGDETDERYEIRKVLAAFYNGFARTLQASVGMLLQEDPTLGEDVPDELAELWENIDAAGTHGAVFARKLATAGIQDGHAGVLVEHSKNPTPGRALSIAEERSAGMRPYLLLFKAHDIFRTLYATVNGVRTLVLLVLRETITERKGKFGVETVEQYRCYTNENGKVSYELWRAGDGETPKIVEGPTVVTNQTEIPWCPFVAGEEVNPGEYKPPLLDLADLNIQYHNIVTNRLSLEFRACVPTLVRIGASEVDGEYPRLSLGPGNTAEVPVIEGVQQPLYWLSVDVSVLAPLGETISSTLAAMATLGAAFLTAETRAAETAEGKRIDSGASRATLATTSRALKDCLEAANGFMAKFRQLDTGGSITLAADFTGEPPDPQMAALFVQAWQAGLLEDTDVRHYLLTGQLPEGFDPADLAAQVTAEARRMAQGGFPQVESQPADAPKSVTIERDENGRPSRLVPAGAAPAKPASAKTAGPEVPETLNGAQITAAVTVLQAVATGEIAEVPAVELLVAVGIPRDRAQTMVREQSAKGVPPAQAVTAVA